MLVIKKEAGIKDLMMVGLLGAGTTMFPGEAEAAKSRHKSVITRPAIPSSRTTKPEKWHLDFPTSQPSSRPSTQPSAQPSSRPEKERSRGDKNNNPGNIDRNKTTKWEGMSADQRDSRFISFETPEYGIRAMTKVISTYVRDHKLNTIEKIIGRWAPPNENNTRAYVNDVAKWSGINSKQIINFQDRDVMFRIIKVMIRKENGYIPYTDDVIRRGIEMAF